MPPSPADKQTEPTTSRALHPSPGSLELSLIIPAYNETNRLPPYLETIRAYIGQRYGTRYEVIVVDDGSSDDMATTINTLSRDWPQLRLIRHGQNLGKGAAVRTGVLAARGMYLLYADADGATPIDQERLLRDAIAQGADIAVGSRLLAAPGVARQRHWHRALIGRTFAHAASLLLPTPVRDTQCGFKMLRAAVARRLFEQSQEKGYLFDLEILAIAERCGYCVREVPISWSDQPGSRLQLHRECGKIVVDLWRLRRRLARLHLGPDP